MIPYRSKRDAPSYTGRLRGQTASFFMPLAWLAAGVAIGFVVLLVWLLPIGGPNGLFGLSRVGQSGSFGAYFAGPVAIAGLPPTVLLILGLVALSAALRIYRRRVAMAVLGHVTSAINLRVPLPPYLRAAAESERPALRKRLLSMADQLAGGRPVGAALEDVAGELPSLTLDRIAAAEQSYALGAGLTPILQRERERLAAVGPAYAAGRYAAFLATFLVLVTSLILVFVIPKFAQIFADFHIQLPWITQAFLRLVRVMFVGGFGFGFGPDVATTVFFLLLLPLVAWLIGSMIARATRGLFTSRPTRRWTAPLTDRLSWYTPLLGRMTRNRHAAVACEALAEAMAAGRPLPDAIDTATLPSLNLVLRRRMRRWQAAVDAGEPAAASARAAKLPPVWCDALAGGASDPAAAMAFASRAYQASWQRASAITNAVLPVAVTFVAGLGVAFVALALFTPLVSLVESMTGGPGGWWK